MVALLQPDADMVVVTRSRHPRAMAPAVLGSLARLAGCSKVVETTTVSEALDVAMAGAAPEDVVCGAGSLFVAAEMREAWLTRSPASLAQDDWARLAEPPGPSWQVAQSR
jgi:dihydrofolate synthase/folylpolyglutamate synthase